HGYYDLTGTLPVPVVARRVAERPTARAVPVCWSSSNGALYHLSPIRAGLTPPGDFWMGYEDLAYGWTLDAHGYEQVVCTDAIFQDTYEFRQAASGYGPRLTSKPSWYAYYNARNFWRAAAETRQPGWVRAAVLARLCAEVCVTATLRPKKAERL